MRLGLGVSLQSRVAVEQELEAGTLAEINVRGGLAAARSGTPSVPRRFQPRPSVQEFLRFLKDKQNTMNHR